MTAAALALALTGCTGDGDGDDPGGPAPQATAEEGVPGGDPTSSASPDDDGCVDLPYDDDGDYSAGDAGTARVVLEGDALVVEEVQPAEGWEHEVTAEQADDVEITFRGDGGEVELSVELDDDQGLAEVELCTDARP
ncbi:hypothetical protein ICW40_06475 [Actinotalea ferrariae]|uniref:hypothetical protein n=1 Tax=Actinotalea ferrariae TaxID=1386098 RepID=UPI001C8C09EA|nr:hypothetical protein [Actinotalea ferrariae]MBX9244450.1 hypothetical protein [Actinotalea ferrariae]